MPITTKKLPSLTTVAGVVTYQTRKTMELKAAESFAKCIAANPYFSDAVVVKTRAKKDSWRVCYAPMNHLRHEEIIQILQAQDEARADRDGEHFRYRLILQGVTVDDDVYLCEGLTDSYHTTTNSCTCLHYTCRRRSVGLVCKHSIELKRRLNRSDEETAGTDLGDEDDFADLIGILANTEELGNLDDLSDDDGYYLVLPSEEPSARPVEPEIEYFSGFLPEPPASYTGITSSGRVAAYIANQPRVSLNIAADFD